MNKPQPTRYRVDIWLSLPQCYTEYTSRAGVDTLEMAESLAEHLRRNRTKHRIVELPSGNVISEWEAS